MKMAAKTMMLGVIAVLIAGCGKGTEAVVQLQGNTPMARTQNTVDKDGNIAETRTAAVFCPGCRKSIDMGAKSCKDRNNCGIEIDWPKDVTCRYCTGDGICPACAWLEQSEKGECFNCKGEGVIGYRGETAICANCKDEKTCPICKGTHKCDMCEGSGRLGMDKLEKLVERGKPEY